MKQLMGNYEFREMELPDEGVYSWVRFGKCCTGCYVGLASCGSSGDGCFKGVVGWESIGYYILQPYAFFY